MSTATAPIKVDNETNTLISHASHFLGRSKKEIVDEAVRDYISAHREQLQKNVYEALRQLDGTTKSSVALLTGYTNEELEELGGFAD